VSDPSRREAPHAGSRRQDVDDTDRALLRALRDDARTSVTDLARQANVSRANAYARLERLTESGVIEGYTVRLDPRAIGLEVTALIFLTAEQARWREVRERLQHIPEIQFIGLATGDFDLVVLVRTTSPDMLRDVVLERFHAMPEIRSTRTMLLLDDLDRGPIIPDAPEPPVRPRARAPRGRA
jgi:DNA-binding Lrp family transcriptional regulator